jgi:hypothetical protein
MPCSGLRTLGCRVGSRGLFSAGGSAKAINEAESFVHSECETREGWRYPPQHVHAKQAPLWIPSKWVHQLLARRQPAAGTPPVLRREAVVAIGHNTRTSENNTVPLQLIDHN